MKLTNRKGFTLIELVIVLAIAALIIVAILLAVSGAQRSRRDQARKTDLARLLANGETYESNHASALPAFANLDSSSPGMQDPSGGCYYINTPCPAGAGFVKYTPGTAPSAKACDNSTALSAREMRIEMTLESGDVACVDDH